MAREKSPDQKRAYKLWIDSEKTMKPAAIAEQLGLSAALVRKWKSYYKWEEIKPKGRGAPKGNKNAKGNKGGGPLGNDKAVKHGLFRKFLPDDPDTLEIFDATNELDPIEILWTSIRICLTNLILSQNLMHVTKRDKYRLDKQATVLTSQSAAMRTLSSKIEQYEDMCRQGLADEEQKLRIEKLKIQVNALGGDKKAKKLESFL